MPYDERADLIGSCEATLDTLGLLLGDLSEEVAESPGDWSIAQILNHLLDTENRFIGRDRRAPPHGPASPTALPDPRDTTRPAPPERHRCVEPGHSARKYS